jgi:succinate dehydrogenase / fumarate reductase cytochrome b subunit
MTTPTSEKAARPLSPHLQIYKPQLTSGMSIFHRMTGIALACGLPVFVLWLVVAAGGPEIYVNFINLFHNIIGQILLFGWTFAFFYHFCCGIRHLLWDAGYGLTIKAVYTSGYIAIGIAVLATACVWFRVYGMAS